MIRDVFLDTNILIDVMARREPHFEASKNVMILGIQGLIRLFATPLTFANCEYILKRHHKDIESPVAVIRAYKQYVTALTMDDELCEKALDGQGKDFEDRLQYEAAVEGGCDCIITRDENKGHFPTDGIPVYTAEQFMKLYY